MKREIPKLEPVVPPTYRSTSPWTYVVKAGSFLFLSGSISKNLKTGEILHGDITFQTKKILQNMKELLEICGSSLKDILQMTIYLRNYEESYPKMMSVFSKEFNTNTPVRSTIGVTHLYENLDVMIDAIAIVSKKKQNSK